MSAATEARAPALAAPCDETLDDMRRRLLARPPQTSGVERAGPFRVRINDAANFYMMYKDIFVNRCYHFSTRRAAPLVLDCGANIGLATLYFRMSHPTARIVAFEPDTEVLPILKENLESNAVRGVRISEAAVGAPGREQVFYGDGKYAGALARHAGAAAACDRSAYRVTVARLSEIATEPVAFLKLNIEGAEWEALDELGDRLRAIDQLVIEYHHLAGLPRTLHRILARLDDCGFDYLVNHFDYETNPGARPPFRLERHSPYYALVYARQRT